MMIIKKLIHNTAKKFGISINKISPQNSVEAGIYQIIKTNKINLILDVGASEGQYASNIFDMGYKGKIISFEPLSDSYKKLLLKKNQNLSWDWEIYPRCALGEENEIKTINISKDKVCSSFLPILQDFTTIIKSAKYVNSEEVEICRLDEILKKSLKGNNAQIFLKIDTQGYEDKVLRGASKILDDIKVIQSEMSLIPLYKDQILFEESLKQLKDLGFKLYTLYPVCIDKETGRTLQVDGIFIKI